MPKEAGGESVGKLEDIADDITDLIKAAGAIVLFYGLGYAVYKILAWISSL